MTSEGRKSTDNLLLQKIAPVIHQIRGERVILDFDLAKIYGVSTMRLNEQVKRNKNRFPEDFAFRLTRDEFPDLVADVSYRVLSLSMARSWQPMC